MKNKYFLLVYITLPFFANAQTLEERNKLALSSNREANKILREELMQQEKTTRFRISQYLNSNPLEKKKIHFGENNEGILELMDVIPTGEKIYAKTYNAGAATTARANHLYNGGSLGINIQGQNMTAGVWDGGNARNTHQEFMVGGVSKITLADGTLFEDHPTHVAGTIAAQGINSLARGLAFNSKVISYDWTSDLSEMLDEAEDGMLVSNHSYGIGQLGSIWFYGAYDSRARQMDNICYNNPYYLPVVSAGNDRNATQAPGSTQLNNKLGYDMIFGHGNAKNVMTVAAVAQVTNYTDPTSVVMSSFSSWGPSDDGRIKPDISMKGVSVRSTLGSSDTAIGSMSGTSMASPGITGVVLLLQQYYNQLYSNYMKAATVKGLILHTADEAGQYTGPDYEFGWGLVNAQKAAIAIRDKNSTTSTSTSLIEELSLSNNSTYTKTVTSTSSTPLKVSISWTDPQSSFQNNGTTDPSTVYLVNDLDVKVTKDDTTYYPWKLQGMATPYSAPTNNSTNNVDNFERVDINNPAGTYTITVTHKNSLSGGSQNFSLIVTGDNLSTLDTKDINNSVKEVSFYPNPAKDFIKIDDVDARESIVKIFDRSGKLVLSTQAQNGIITISQLIVGTYIGSYQNKKGENKTFKFIKE